VAGWCSGKQRVFCIQVGACINPFGAGIFMELVLEKLESFSLKQVGACISGSRCFHPVSAGTLRELVLPSSRC
jgi:hypothetical protein